MIKIDLVNSSTQKYHQCNSIITWHHWYDNIQVSFRKRLHTENIFICNLAAVVIIKINFSSQFSIMQPNINAEETKPAQDLKKGTDHNDSPFNYLNTKDLLCLFSLLVLSCFTRLSLIGIPLDTVYDYHYDALTIDSMRSILGHS